eukprot:1628219-Pyramimonas_sp.AAC.1
MGLKLDLSNVMESKVGSTVVYGTAGVTALYVAYKLYGGDTGFRTSIFKAFNCGNLTKEQVKGGIDGYEEFFTQVGCVRTDLSRPNSRVIT